ncbi:regulator of G-protein signaling 22-like [Actinia tenebrosa]|uniref:Regulator of G-protein signaling 22-like n=1 Tax=Actinia tenebrosa TaxID=6105 RepID=A0A6P8H2P3_ACTTE|nr:regulator of G-protein signaling 22-like [Actinia tenebrosa]
MLEQSITEPEELSVENLEVFLEEQTFVDYFNTFLALPCFAERLFYNKEFAQFEEFIERLADDVGAGDAHAASQLRKLTHFKGTIYNVTNNQSRIGYYVMVLDKAQGLDYVKKYRVPLFLRSELYAEYKLTMVLSTVQSTFLGDFRMDEEFSIVASTTISNRKRSAVSFNLSSPDREDFSSLGERSTADSPHIRTLDDTFSAWNDSFRRADSRGSLYSYAGGSQFSRTPDIVFEDGSESSTTSSCENDKETDSRPSSRMSFVSNVSGVSANSVSISNAGSVKSIESEGSIRCVGEKRPEPNSQISGENITEDKTMENENATDSNDVLNEDFKKSISNEIFAEISHDKSTMHKENSKEKEVGFSNGDKDLRESVDFDNTLSGKNESQNIVDDSETGEISKKSETFAPEQQKERVKSLPSSPESSARENAEVLENEGMTSLKSSRISSAPSKGDEKQMIEAEIISRPSEAKEELVENEKLVEMPKSQPSTSNSDFSSEVSIPIIVSDDGHSGTADEVSIKDRSFSIATKEHENSKTDRTETTNGIPSMTENEVEEGRIGKRPRNIGSGDSSNRDITSVQEEDEDNESEDKKSEKLIDLTNVGDEGELGSEDPNLDVETGSQYTLKGIQGILNARRRVSIAATSVGFDLDDIDGLDDDDWCEEDKPYDLSTKEGLDEFKEFLLGTNGEKFLRFWIEVECAKYVEDDSETQIITRTIIEKYWKTGSLYELSRDVKRKLGLEDSSKVTYTKIMDEHYKVLDPIMNYWCPRFTMHQQNRSDSQALDYVRLMAERPRTAVRSENDSTSLAQEPDACGMSQMTYKKQLIRPKSCRTQGGEGESRPITAKQKLRAKSAHPRLIPATTPVNTNASTIQLQNVTAPIRKSCGFMLNQPLSFQGHHQPDYASSVRLYIKPVPTPDGKLTKLLGRLQRTAVRTEAPQQVKNSEEEEVNTGSDEINSLIEGLILERQTGGYFQKAIQNMGNKLWIDCLSFWKSLQEYNALFFADSLNPSTLSSKAMLMYARYVVPSGAQCIGVSKDIENQVFKQVDPPYEELFDGVEDHALHCLLEPWKQLKEQGKDDYSTIPIEQKLRHIEIKVMQKRRQSVIQTHEHDGIDEDIEKEKISIEEASRPMPVPKDGFSFETLIRNRNEVEHFREFLSKKHTKGIKDLMAWTDMETLRRIPRFLDEKRDQKAKDVKSSWLTKNYFFGNDSPATREGQDLIMSINGNRVIKERPTTPVISEAQKFVRARIERRWLMLFKQTAEFMERQKPRVTAPEVVEDVMLKRRLQRSEAAWKILNSRWVSSSRDVVALRTCLLNPQSCAEFRTFVALKGDTFENDVDFWLEVQKFKDLCHAHAQESFVRRKVQAITDCYLNSAIAPELQIDIPIEMAEKLLEKLTGRLTMHPYIFREAQMTVFRILFNHWKEFITYRSKLPADKSLLDHLQEKLTAQRAETKAKREASERRRLARLSAERKKKEKEEREKKRMEDLASLFSIDTASVFYSEVEDEMNSWYYSKHVVEQERQEHIKRLKEQGLEIPPELLLEEKEETKSRRSLLSSIKPIGQDGKPIKDKKRQSMSVQGGISDKEESEKDGPKGLQAKLLQNLKKQYAGQTTASLLPGRRGSTLSVALSLRRNSNMSRKSDKVSIQEEKNSSETKDTDKDQQEDAKEGESKTAEKDGKSRIKAKQEIPKVLVDEIQVIPDESTDDDRDDDDKRKFTQQAKLLGSRGQRNKRLLQPAGKGSRVKKGVPLDAISCISDYSMISNIDYQHVKKSKVAQRSGAATPLTFKSLKDFTNSPEGAPLAIPLPLVRITSASHKDGSKDDTSQVDPGTKTRNILSSTKPRMSSAKRKALEAKKRDSVVPDVIVN